MVALQQQSQILPAAFPKPYAKPSIPSSVGAPRAPQNDGLFAPLTIKNLTLKNRIMVSPMCQYSAYDGVPNAWHFSHLTQYAIRGSGLIMAEATAVSHEGRITPRCTGIYTDEQENVWKGIVDGVHTLGEGKIGIQIAHAGRKASTYEIFDPVRNGTSTAPRSYGGWADSPNEVLAPTAEKFQDDYPLPKEARKEDIKRLVQAFADAAQRADRAGFDVVELHMAHGYLIHEFYSPLSNKRTDDYGGSFENRVRFAVEIARAVRAVWPQNKPLFARISCTDWVEGGWDLDQSIALARLLHAEGVDVVDCSSGGASPRQEIPNAFNSFQVPFAERIRKEVPGLLTMAVGQITDAKEADGIIRNGQADLVALARVLLANPNWPLDAAKELQVDVIWSPQYLYGAGSKSKRRQIAEEKARQVELKHGAVTASS
ncbi:hypothetical protein SpCBS45565_g08488 [Spizellomyces sp. 'palustris']|nr:hypothetical protein SpCBS45565_g08488 [Spizellomyces sp. 'palustris']